MATELTRDDILAAGELRHESVTVPEWSGEVLVWEMSARDRDRFDGSLATNNGDGANMDNIRARLVVMCVRNADGVRLFSDADADILGERSRIGMTRVADIAQRVNGMVSDDDDGETGLGKG